jgi:hypothetical protein
MSGYNGLNQEIGRASLGAILEFIGVLPWSLGVGMSQI